MKIFDLFMPQDVKCIFCGEEVNDGVSLCKKCKESLPYMIKNICPVCGSYSDGGDEKICSYCFRNKDIQYDRCYCILEYSGRIPGVLYEIKNESKKYYLTAFSHIMCEKYKSIDINFDYVVPVPMTLERKKHRGFNQSEELTKVIDNEFGNVNLNLLLKTKSTDHQTGLNQKNRKENLKGSFSVNTEIPLKNKTILVVDDVSTTGSTINECARVLKKSGAQKVYGLCLCSPLRKDEDIYHI